MLWWDDGFSLKKNNKKTASNGTINGEDSDASDPVVSCYRSTGAVPIPRKVSLTSMPGAKTAVRKVSAPDLAAAAGPNRPRLTRKISCPIDPVAATLKGPDKNYGTRCKPIVELKTLKANQEIIEELSYEKEEEFSGSQSPFSTKAKLSQEPARAPLYPKISKVRVLTGKVETQEPDAKKELKRGSMKEKWGLSLVYQLMDSRLQLAVNKVSMFSPAAKAGIQPGNTILIINDWKIEAMDQPQVAVNLLMAAGFSVNLALRNTQLELADWTGIEVL